MAFYGYKGDAGECYWTPHSSNYDYDVVPPHASLTYSANEFDEPKFVEHIPYDYLASSTTQEVHNFSIYNYSEPRIVQYEPPSFANGTFYSQRNYVISYSTLKFNEPDFEEYDPTPYGGGYYPIQTYGKPLPPSDEICYPRSMPLLDSLSLDGFSYGSTSSPYGGNDDHSMKPLKDNGNKPGDNQEQQSYGNNGDKVTSGHDTVEDGDLNTTIEAKSGDVEERPAFDDNNGFENGRIGGYKQIPYIPYGSGLEAMDLCESIFGYWPCLAKVDQQRNVNREVSEEESQHDPWKSAAEYLFGSPFVYGEQKDGGNGYYTYGNES